MNKRIFFSFFCSLTLLAASFSGEAEARSFEEVKQLVRDKFPTVNQLSVGDYRKEIQLSENNSHVLLDVRDKEEYEVSHISGAKLSPSVRRAVAILKGKPRDTKIVVYCSVGYRSSSLAAKLIKRGYTNVHNLEGSIFEWANNDFPVFRGNAEVHEVHIYNKTWGKLLKSEFHPREC